MKKFAIVVVAGLLLAAPVGAQDNGGGGGWTVQSGAFGTTVSNAEKNISFKAPEEKAGQEMADKLNKIDKRQDKKNKDD